MLLRFTVEQAVEDLVGDERNSTFLHERLVCLYQSRGAVVRDANGFDEAHIVTLCNAVPVGLVKEISGPVELVKIDCVYANALCRSFAGLDDCVAIITKRYQWSKLGSNDRTGEKWAQNSETDDAEIAVKRVRGMEEGMMWMEGGVKVLLRVLILHTLVGTKETSAPPLRFPKSIYFRGVKKIYPAFQ